MNPSSPQVDNLLATANRHLQAGRLAEAATLYRQIIATAPRHAEAHHLLGVIAFHGGQFDQADSLVRQAIAIKPKVPGFFNTLGLVLEGKGEIEAASAQWRQALKLNPRHPEAHCNLAKALYQSRHYTQAESHYQKALKAKPEFYEALNNLGVLLQARGRIKEAVQVFRRAVRTFPQSAEVHNNLGSGLKALGRVDEAREHFRRAVALDPGLAQAYLNMANLKMDEGEKAEARMFSEKALEVRPHFPEALRNLADLERCKSTDDSRLGKIFEALEAPGLDGSGEIDLRFALGKLLDDCGAYDQAFEQYRLGNALKRRSTPFDRAGMEALVAKLKAFFTPERFTPGEEHRSESELPLFIVGMPRSGTSLVEQIVASHPGVHGAGELTWFNEVVADSARWPGKEGYPQAMEKMRPKRLAALGDAYLRHLRSLGGDAVLRVSDKMPGNFMHLGLIGLLFPRACIIHVCRHPLDTLLSIYFQHFSVGNSYAYDLEDIAFAYRAYRDLMAHWERVMPGRIYHQSYEDLVARQEAESRDLMAFVGLPWDDACCDFYVTRRAVATASAMQVRQPMYRHSLARWHHYRTQLADIRLALADLLPPAGRPDAPH